MPRVSVIIPTFNCARFLGDAITSALAQTYTDYEVIVVDDGSTDETRDVVARFDDKVRYLYQSNRGPTPARNLALSQATGELMACLDADDVWYPQKLERQVAFLDAHQKCGLVHSDVTVIDETDQLMHSRFNHETGRLIPQGHCTLELLKRHHTQLSVVVARRASLGKAGKFDERVQGSADYLQWILMTLDGMAIGYIDEPLAVYRWRKEAMHTDQRRMLTELVLLFNILLRETPLVSRFGEEAADIVRAQLYVLQRELAYVDRAAGRADDARRRVISLLHEWPLEATLYVDLLKAFVPPPVATRLRRLREMWA